MANNDLKVVVEANVPFLEPLGQVAEVVRLPYDKITPETISDADALVVRTRNRCDAALLGKSKVRFIATATIGTDHIDLPWCREHGITAVNAPGCNAPAVAQYVFSSLMRVINRPINQYVIGIVGVGHVGSIVERWARALDMKVLRCDPLRQAAEGGEDWASLDEIARKADIITFHTPLTRTGDHATYHLADRQFFESLRRAPIVINSARGPITDNAAWVDAIRKGLVSHSIIDCWEGEPNLNPELLALADIATPHIAGYSIEGKRRASQMALDALCSHFGLEPLRIEGEIPPPPARSITPAVAFEGYNPLEDTELLRQTPEKFEHLRNTYNLRPELPERFSN